jgi:hypothetical protein
MLDILRTAFESPRPSVPATILGVAWVIGWMVKQTLQATPRLLHALDKRAAARQALRGTPDERRQGYRVLEILQEDGTNPVQEPSRQRSPRHSSSGAREPPGKQGVAAAGEASKAWPLRGLGAPG